MSDEMDIGGEFEPVEDLEDDLDEGGLAFDDEEEEYKPAAFHNV